MTVSPIQAGATIKARADEEAPENVMAGVMPGEVSDAPAGKDDEDAVEDCWQGLGTPDSSCCAVQCPAGASPLRTYWALQ